MSALPCPRGLGRHPLLPLLVTWMATSCCELCGKRVYGRCRVWTSLRFFCAKTRYFCSFCGLGFPGCSLKVAISVDRSEHLRYLRELRRGHEAAESDAPRMELALTDWEARGVSHVQRHAVSAAKGRCPVDKASPPSLGEKVPTGVVFDDVSEEHLWGFVALRELEDSAVVCSNEKHGTHHATRTRKSDASSAHHSPLTMHHPALLSRLPIAPSFNFQPRQRRQPQLFQRRGQPQGLDERGEHLWSLHQDNER